MQEVAETAAGAPRPRLPRKMRGVGVIALFLPAIVIIVLGVSAVHGAHKDLAQDAAEVLGPAWQQGSGEPGSFVSGELVSAHRYSTGIAVRLLLWYVSGCRMSYGACRGMLHAPCAVPTLPFPTVLTHRSHPLSARNQCALHSSGALNKVGVLRPLGMHCGACSGAVVASSHGNANADGLPGCA